MTWVVKTIGVCDSCGPKDSRELFYNTWNRALCWSCANLEGKNPPVSIWEDYLKTKIDRLLKEVHRLRQELEKIDEKA